jgi:DNA-binding MarR family transcriptional regulator
MLGYCQGLTMTRASTRKTSASHRRIELDAIPGHCIRRLQQIAVAIFMQESVSSGVTPVQFAVLQTLADQPGIDQRTLARVVSFDTSTIGGVIDRLEARGLLTRSLSPEDRRVRLLHLTPEGEALLPDLAPSVQRTQDRILEPLSGTERKEFMRMMQLVIGHHDELGRSDAPGT